MQAGEFWKASAAVTIGACGLCVNYGSQTDETRDSAVEGEAPAREHEALWAAWTGA